jgi:hypothetical protein
MKMKVLINAFVLLFFVNSLAFCQDYTVDYSFNNGYTLVYKIPAAANQNAPEKTYGVINNENKIVVPIQYRAIMVSGGKDIFIIKDSRDNTGLFSALTQKMIVEPQYFEIETFSEGLAVVKKRKSGTGFLWGAIDVNGKVIIPVEYDYLGPSSEGLTNFKKDNKMGFMDKMNNIIIPAMYDNYSSFSDGLAAVKTIPGGRYGYIDKTNNMVIAAQYEDANPFNGGFASVAKKKGYTTGSAGKPGVTVPGQWVLINKTGKIIQERTFDRISLLNAGGLFIIESEGKKGTMNTEGMPILPIEYSEVNIDKSGYIIYKTPDKKFGMMSNRGSNIVSPVYDHVSYTTAARYYTLLKGKYEVSDVNKNILIPADSANV